MNQRTTSPTAPDRTATGTFTISDDGYIRIACLQLQTVHLVHLISGLDDGPDPTGFAGAMSTAIGGYTEWVSELPPVITLGWDWVLEALPTGTRLRKVGDPRSNLMLQDAGGADIGPARTSLLLEALIETMNWQDTVKQHIFARYSV